jgi:tight adherence protein C
MDLITLSFALVVGFAVCLLAFGISAIVSNATDPVRRRVVAATSAHAAKAGESNERKLPFDLQKLIKPVAKYVLPSKSEEQSQTRRKLIQAGFRGPNAVTQFYSAKAALALAFPIVILFAIRFTPTLPVSQIFFAVVLAGFFGVRLPDMVVGRIRTKRIKRLRDGFPDSLDLLVVCVESGLGLIPAIERVAREIEISHEDLAHEYSLVTAEIRAGVERPVALKNLATRSGLEDINGLVALLIQTIRFGTSVADALRVYSEEFRDKRMQKAEEQAAKIGTKMIFPMVFCFFPSFFIVAIGPAVMRIVAAFQSMQ